MKIVNRGIVMNCPICETELHQGIYSQDEDYVFIDPDKFDDLLTLKTEEDFLKERIMPYTKYTVTVNRNEYATGIYNSHKEAVAEVKRRMVEDGYFGVPTDEDFDIDEYDPDGYYGVMDIINTKGWAREGEDDWQN